MAKWEDVHQHSGYRNLCRSLVQRCDLYSGQRVADIGTGSGLVPEIIGEMGPQDVFVSAVDPDPEMLALVPRGPLAGLSTHQCGFENLADTFDPESLDRVIAANSLHLAADVRVALLGVARILKPKGVFGLLSGYFDGAVVPSDIPIYTKVLRKAVKILRTRYPHGQAAPLINRGSVNRIEIDRAELYSRMERAGLAVMHSEVLTLNFDAELAAATVGSEMFATGVFTQVDPQIAQRALVEAVTEVADDMGGLNITRNFLLATATTS